jgi:hypothetical protein
MNKPHKHAEFIKAWADGAEIERKCDLTGYWFLLKNPAWCEDFEYRIKPQPVIKKMYMHYDGIEEVVAENFWHTKDVPQQMYFNNNNMSNHLEFTFVDDKLTSVEIKKT